MLVLLIPSLVLQERAKLQRTVLDKIKRNYLRFVSNIQGLCLEDVRTARLLHLRLKVSGSIQDFYNQCDALFNTLKIDQVRQLPKHRMVCGYGSGASSEFSSRVAPACIIFREASCRF